VGFTNLSSFPSGLEDTIIGKFFVSKDVALIAGFGFSNASGDPGMPDGTDLSLLVGARKYLKKEDFAPFVEGIFVYLTQTARSWIRSACSRISVRNISCTSSSVLRAASALAAHGGNEYRSERRQHDIWHQLAWRPRELLFLNAFQVSNCRRDPPSVVQRPIPGGTCLRGFFYRDRSMLPQAICRKFPVNTA